MRLVLELCSHDLNKACDILGTSLKAERLCKLLRKMKMKKRPSESPNINVSEDQDSWVNAALAFYKGSKIVSNAGLRITIQGQPGVDTG